MREIIHIQVGQCGNQIGTQFWRDISAEHKIDHSPIVPKSSIDGEEHQQQDGEQQSTENQRGFHVSHEYFEEKESGKYVPRAILVDMDPTTLDHIRDSAPFFGSDHFVSGKNGSGNNFAKGFYTDGTDILPQVLDAIRNVADKCESLQGFQLVHSLGGGCGSGFTALLAEKLREIYYDKVQFNYTLLPATFAPGPVTEPYNTVLALHHYIENSDMMMYFDNDALHDISQRTINAKKTDFNYVNNLVSSAMCGITSSFRFPCQVNNNLRKMAVNLVPFPRVKHCYVAYAPFKPHTPTETQILSVPGLIHQIFSASNKMTSGAINNGRYLTAAVTFRGKVSPNEVDAQMANMVNRSSSYFCEWIPNNVQTSMCNVPDKESPMTATLVANNYSIKDNFSQIAEKFTTMFRRKAYIHWYTGEGMDEMEFTEAESNLNDMISEYHGPCSGCCVDEEEWYDEEYEAEIE